MTVEVLNTGTEILLGRTVNTHVGFLAQELFPIGLRISRQVCVPDGPAIRDALAEALERADIVIVTGGLGPTTDDQTREIAADLLGLPLRQDPTVMAAIEARFQRRALPMPARNRRQAMVPDGAKVLPNPHGTAPGLYLGVHRNGAGGERHLFLLPGPPRELRPMVTNQLVPILRGLVPGAAARLCRNYRVSGLGESAIEALVGEALAAIPGLELGYCARPGEVEVRCIGDDPALARADAILRSHLAGRISSFDGLPLEVELVRCLTALGRTLALAESCTGGFAAHRITNVPGASQVLLAGYVTYSNAAKTGALGVDPALIERAGAVSAEVAAAMAEGARRVSGADCALALTGIAGPSGATPQKPVGTVFIGLATAGAPTKVEEHHFPTDRETFKSLATQAAFELLRQSLG